jgi:hypothetical protein
VCAYPAQLNFIKTSSLTIELKRGIVRIDD